MGREKISFDKAKDGSRGRVPIHITEQSSNSFGIDVQVNRQKTANQEGIYPSGHPEQGDGQRTVFRGGDGDLAPGNQNYREVIPPGNIGTQEKWDIQLPPPQFVDTVPYSRSEDKEPRLHGAMDAIKVSSAKQIPFNDFASFQPRSAPIPRAAQDEAQFGMVNGRLRLAADPLMTDEDSFTSILPKDDLCRKDLYGQNVAGVLHNDPAGANGQWSNPPDNATEKRIPPSRNPQLRTSVPLNPTTKVLPGRSMPVQGATRAKRGS